MRRRGSSDLGLLSRRRFRSVTHRPVSYLSVSTHLTPSTSRLRGKEPRPAPRIFPFYRGGCHEGDIAKKTVKRVKRRQDVTGSSNRSPKPSLDPDTQLPATRTFGRHSSSSRIEGCGLFVVPAVRAQTGWRKELRKG